MACGIHWAMVGMWGMGNHWASSLMELEVMRNLGLQHTPKPPACPPHRKIDVFSNSPGGAVHPE